MKLCQWCFTAGLCCFQMAKKICRTWLVHFHIQISFKTCIVLDLKTVSFLHCVWFYVVPPYHNSILYWSQPCHPKWQFPHQQAMSCCWKSTTMFAECQGIHSIQMWSQLWILMAYSAAAPIMTVPSASKKKKRRRRLRVYLITQIHNSVSDLHWLCGDGWTETTVWKTWLQDIFAQFVPP